MPRISMRRAAMTIWRLRKSIRALPPAILPRSSFSPRQRKPIRRRWYATRPIPRAGARLAATRPAPAGQARNSSIATERWFRRTVQMGAQEEIAKAVSQAAGVADKALDLVRDVGAWVGSLVEPAAAPLSEMFADQARYWRAKNLNRIAMNYARLEAERPF